MEENYTKYWELILKEKAGIIDDNEQKDLASWQISNPEDYDELLELFKETNDVALPAFDPQNEWDDLQTIIRIEEASKNGNTFRLFPWLARAAAAILIILGVIYVYNRQSSSMDQLIMQTMVMSGEHSQKQVALPDGTTVFLNRGSELLFPETFDQNSREVYLKGEAFFDVAPNKEQPFVVHAGISKTTVLGTSFNLRAYGKEDDIRLTVVSGKVAFTLTDDREKVIVTPGNMANLNRNSKQISHGENPDLNFLSWKTHELKFDNCPLDELVMVLGRHYTVDIRLENDSTRNCRFTGDFKETELDNILEIITRAIGSTYEQTGDFVVILGPGCN
jgi:ferric-dicitrate binding protein FerR (iron transport regulator)